MEKAQVSVSFVIRGLRYCGYNNYNAIFEFIDNAIEAYVKATKVKLSFETQGTGVKKKIRTIVISDNGIGMTIQRLRDSMTIGSETGKVASSDLGFYGAGMKTAALSIGRCLSVYTIPEGNDSELYFSRMRITDDNRDVTVEYITYPKGSDVYKEITDLIGGNHGTVIKVSELEKMSSLDYTNVKNTLYRKISEAYNKFVAAGTVEFYVENKKVEYLELMGTKDSIVIGEGDFDVNGHTISYRAHHLKRLSQANKIVKPENEYDERRINHQGIYIYRNNRLVGKALTLGLWARHSIMNGFRCELFVDGECDNLFGSTFNKMINEKTRDSLDKALSDKLESIILPLWSESRRRTKEAWEKNMVEDPELVNRDKEIYQKVVDEQNANSLLGVRRYGVNTPRAESYSPKSQRGPQKNPNPTRIRKEKWLDSIEEISDGITGLMFQVVKEGKGLKVLINRDHAFYKEFYSLLPEDLKYRASLLLTCEAVAKEKLKYFDDDNFEDYCRVMDFEWERSKAVNGSVRKPCPTSVMKYAEEQEEKREIEESNEKKVRRSRKSKTK